MHRVARASGRHDGSSGCIRKRSRGLDALTNTDLPLCTRARGAIGHSVLVANDERDIEVRRIAARREVVEALLWASEHAQELLAIVSSEATGADAIRRLGQSPYNFTDFQAHHTLDIPFRRLSPQNVALLRGEAERLRRGDDSTSTTWQP